VRAKVEGSLRPFAAGRGSNPISIAEASSGPVQCPVFGEQIDGCTASTRPTAAVRSFLKAPTWTAASLWKLPN